MVIKSVGISSSNPESGALPGSASPFSAEVQKELILSRMYPERNPRRSEELELLQKVLEVPVDSQIEIHGDAASQLGVASTCYEASQFLQAEKNRERILKPALIVDGELAQYPSYVGDGAASVSSELHPVDSSFLSDLSGLLESRAVEIISRLRKDFVEKLQGDRVKRLLGNEAEDELRSLNERLTLSLGIDPNELFQARPQKVSQGFSLNSLNTLVVLTGDDCQLMKETRAQIVNELIAGDSKKLCETISGIVCRSGFRARIREAVMGGEINRDELGLAIRELLASSQVARDRELAKLPIHSGTLSDDALREQVLEKLVPTPSPFETTAILEPWLFSARKLDRDEVHGLLLLAEDASRGLSKDELAVRSVQNTSEHLLKIHAGPMIDPGTFHDATYQIAEDFIARDVEWANDPRSPKAHRRGVSVADLSRYSVDELKALENQMITPSSVPHLPRAIELALLRLGFSEAHVLAEKTDDYGVGTTWQVYLGPFAMFSG